KAQQTLEAEQAERMMKRFQKGLFNMNDLKGQLEQMLKMGGMQGIMGMMPGMGKLSKQMDEAGFDDGVLRRQIALINSMTRKERANPDLLQASRKKRIAAGAGLDVAELNKLLKMHRQMADMMKKMGKMGKGGMLKQAMKGMFGKGGMPDPSKMSPEELEAMAKGVQEGMGGGKMPGGLPAALGRGGLGGLNLPAGLSGVGGFGKKEWAPPRSIRRGCPCAAHGSRTSSTGRRSSPRTDRASSAGPSAGRRAIAPGRPTWRSGPCAAMAPSASTTGRPAPMSARSASTSPKASPNPNLAGSWCPKPKARAKIGRAACRERVSAEGGA